MQSLWTFHAVDLGSETVDLPVYDNGGSGPAVLITAGMDGDEYAGIEAAKRLAAMVKKLRRRVIVCPLINVPGYRIGHSRNPLDGLYPKRIYPGSERGKPSQRQIYWLYRNFIRDADVWIDLHGGATDEKLTPHILSYETGYADVDAKTKKIIASLDAEIICFERPGVLQKVQRLAKEGKTYLLFESGDCGKVREEDVDRHVRWCMSVLGDGRSLKHTVWRTVRDYYAASDGKWISPGIEGLVLYQKRDGMVAKGDVVFSVASDPEML